MAEDIIAEEHLGLGPKVREPSAEDLAGEAVCSSTPGQLGGGDLSLRETVRSNTVHVERIAIAQALRRTGGNKAKAARLLQVDYKTLHSKVKEYGLQIEREQPYD
jgi:two-component system nitrogen regulation response regulator GlnG